MTSRREFLNLAIKGSALTAAAAWGPGGAFAATENMNIGAPTGSAQSTTSSANEGHYRPPFKFGVGGVPLGNEFSVVTDEDANAILEAAWSAGVRYYDVSPWYGLGLAERRFGYFLHNKKRSDYVISSKLKVFPRSLKNLTQQSRNPVAIALVLWFLFFAANAFAVLRSPYPQKPDPPGQIVIITDHSFDNTVGTASKRPSRN